MTDPATQAKMGPPQPVTHVIFDVDGLLLDTERLYTKIMEKICEPHGKQFTWAIKVKQMGRKEHESAKILIDELSLPITVEEYIKQNHQLQKELFPKGELLPGADRLVRHLHNKGVPIAIATGSDRRGFDLKCSGHQEFFKLFNHSVLSTDDPEVKHGKPAPDCFLVAAKRFSENPCPDKVLVFEDAPNGAEAALNAGMQVVWVPDPNVNKSDLGARVTLTLNTLEEFKPKMFGLPAFDS